MKNYLLVLLLFFCVSVSAQQKEDFKLITSIPDTLFWGYQNEVKLETNWDKSRLSFTGTGLQISKTTADDRYLVMVSPPTRKCEIILMYRKSNTEILSFNYSFSATRMSSEMIIRLRELAILRTANADVAGDPNQYPKREDFELVSFFQDTLIANESNQISIRTKWDKSKIYLASGGQLALYSEEKDVYYIPGSNAGEIQEIRLGYIAGETERFYFDYPMVTASLNREMNNRRRVASGLEKIPDDQLLREDIKLVTFFKDTLITGFDNIITVETTWENLNIYLEYNGNYNFLRYHEQEGCYKINPGIYPGYGDINLYINKEGTAHKTEIEYSFTIVNMSSEMNSRLKKFLSIPPEEDFTLTKIPSGKSKNTVELVLQKSIPDYYSPLLISRNKQYAVLYNSDTDKGAILDLKNKKLIVSESDYIKMYSTENTIISNTGRYLFLGNFWFDQRDPDNLTYYPILHDVFAKKDIILDQDFLKKYITIEIEQFSNDDSYFTYSGIDSLTENKILAISSINGNFNCEIETSGNAPVASYIKPDNSSLSVCSYNWQYADQPTYYIDAVDFRKNSTVLKDSICLDSAPFEIKMENQFLIIGYNHVKTKSPCYLFYDLENFKQVARIELNAKFQTENGERLFTSINPEGTQALIGIENHEGKNETKLFFFNLGQAKADHELVYTPGQSLRHPLFLSDNTIFAVAGFDKTYLDLPGEELFWHDLKTKAESSYQPPITLYSDYWGYTNSTDFPVNNSSPFMSVQITDYKNGNEETVQIKADSLDQATFRFGTKIKTTAERYFAIYEFNLAELKLVPLHEFKEYVPEVKSDDFMRGAEQYSTGFIKHQDSLVQLHVDPDNVLGSFETPQLIHIHDSTKLIFGDPVNSGFFFYNFQKKKRNERIVHFVILKTHEWILYTDDMYYACSFINEPSFQFSIQGKLYPFEQFDLKYNRPDIILDRLGYADSRLIDAYYQAYQKRLRKMGFTEDMLTDDMNLPEISIENYESIPSVTSDDTLRLNLKMEDLNYPLDRINLWVNDVAIYGTQGISLRNLNTGSIEKMMPVPLVLGNNKIQVSVLNMAGAESYKAQVEMECTSGKQKPDLYIITIGISNYSDSRYNLSYAAKDADDLRLLFEESKFYENVFSKSLIDENVTKENLPALADFLQQADINDQVILFVAGHGVLDADFNYYFASHDMDFQNPSARGIPYEALEGLLDGIKPLKKLLFMDTCHSGEVDKDEIQVSENQTDSENDIVFRHVGVAVENKEKQLGLQNTSELMRSMFTDLRKGTGATVISSAGGIEFAMESDEWQNGLFTYCLLHGLTKGAADLNQDKQIDVSEIQAYVQSEVARLSGGKQTPTSRIRNNEMDYRIW